MIRKVLISILFLFAVAACGRKTEPLRPDMDAPTYGPGETNMQPTSDPNERPIDEQSPASKQAQ